MRPVTLAFLGDLMLVRRIHEALRSGPPEALWNDVLPVLTGADAVFGNLECAITARSEPWRRTPKRFHFRTDPAAVAALQAANIRFVSLANNHTLDFETAGLFDTLETLDAAGIQHAGAGRNLEEAMAPALLDVAGLKIGVIALADHIEAFAATVERPGIYWVKRDADPEELIEPIRERIAGMKAAGADLLLLSAHLGPNFVEAPHKRLREFMQRVVDLGIDLVHGHSAHVCQGVETHGRGLVLHDCGDFIADAVLDPGLPLALSFVFLVEADHEGLRKLRLVPVHIDHRGVHLAKDADFATICARMMRLCAALGTAVNPTDEGLELPLRRRAGQSVPVTMPTGFDLKFADRVSLFLLDDEGLLFVEDAQEIYALNTAACLVWCWIEEGFDRDRIAVLLSESTGASSADAEAYLAALLDQWRRLGLFAHQSPAVALEGRVPTANQPAPRDSAVGGLDRRFAAARHYRLLGTNFRLRCTAPAQMDWVHPLVAQLEQARADAPQVSIDIVDEDKGHRVYRDGEPFLFCPGLDWLGPEVLSLLRNAVAERHHHVVGFRASVVTEGQGVILLQRTRRGVTAALVAALLQAEFRLLAHESARLEAPDLSIAPSPFGVEVRSAHWPEIADIVPGFDELAVHRRKGGEPLRYLEAPPRGAVSDSLRNSPASHVVFPVFAPDRPASATALSRAEAVSRLMNGHITTSEALDQETIGRLTHWIKSADCYEMTFPSFEDGVDLVRRLVSLETTDPP